jgi:O-antigen/teichoic acid export membrane protein
LKKYVNKIRNVISIFIGNRFSRDVLWNATGLAILGISGILINMIIMACRGPQALGIFNQVFAFYVIISQVTVGGFQFSVLKHCSYQQGNLAECAVITSSAFMLVAFVGAVICVIFFGLRDIIGNIFSPSVAMGLAFAIPGIFCYSLNKVLLMALNGLRNMRAFAVFQAFRYILILISVATIIYFKYPDTHLPLSLTIAEIVLFIFLLLYVNIVLFRIHFSFKSPMQAWFKQHISFGSRGFLSGVLIEMNTRVDVLMLGYFMSDMIVGIYSFASTFAEGFAQLSTIISQNVNPIIGRCFAEGKKASIKEIVIKIRNIFYPIMFIIGFMLVLVFPILIRLVGLGREGFQSWGVFAILTCGIVLISGYKPFFATLIQGGRPGMYTLLIAGSVIANIVLNVFLIPILGIYGAAIATVCAYLLEIRVFIFLVKRLFGIKL